MLKAIAYVRVSDKEQGKEERFSIPHQKEHIEEYCRQRRWNLAHVFEDVESGKGTARRKGLKAALKALEDADILIVHELDRLSRNLMDTLLIVDDVGRARKSFVSIHDNIDSSADEKWELQFHILAVFAHYFRRQLSRKVHETMMTKAQKGEWNSKPPFGYIIQGKRLAVNEEEAWIVRRIFDLYLNQHVGIRSIVIDLNKDIRAKNGGIWYQREVRRILSSPAYTGDTVWNIRKRIGTKETFRSEEEWIIVRDTHPAIIDRETFQAVQDKLKIKAELRGANRSQSYLLSGVLYCGYCDGKMYGANEKSHFSKLKGRSLDHYRYRCDQYCKKGICRNFKLEAAQIDGEVIKYIENYLGTKEDTRELLKNRQQYDPRAIADKRRKLDGLKKSLAAVPEKLDRQMQMYENMKITEGEFERARARVLGEEKNLKEEIAKLESEVAEIDEDEIRRHSMADFYEVFSSGDVMAKKAWIQKHISKIVAMPDKFRVSFKEL